MSKAKEIFDECFSQYFKCISDKLVISNLSPDSKELNGTYAFQCSQEEIKLSLQLHNGLKLFDYNLSNDTLKMANDQDPDAIDWELWQKTFERMMRDLSTNKAMLLMKEDPNQVLENASEESVEDLKQFLDESEHSAHFNSENIKHLSKDELKSIIGGVITGVTPYATPTSDPSKYIDRKYQDDVVSVLRDRFNVDDAQGLKQVRNRSILGRFDKAMRRFGNRARYMFVSASKVNLATDRDIRVSEKPTRETRIKLTENKYVTPDGRIFAKTLIGKDKHVGSVDAEGIIHDIKGEVVRGKDGEVKVIEGARLESAPQSAAKEDWHAAVVDFEHAKVQLEGQNVGIIEGSNMKGRIKDRSGNEVARMSFGQLTHDGEYVGRVTAEGTVISGAPEEHISDQFKLSSDGKYLSILDEHDSVVAVVRDGVVRDVTTGVTVDEGGKAHFKGPRVGAHVEFEGSQFIVKTEDLQTGEAKTVFEVKLGRLNEKFIDAKAVGNKVSASGHVSNSAGETIGVIEGVPGDIQELKDAVGDTLGYVKDGFIYTFEEEAAVATTETAAATATHFINDVGEIDDISNYVVPSNAGAIYHDTLSGIFKSNYDELTEKYYIALPSLRRDWTAEGLSSEQINHLETAIIGLHDVGEQLEGPTVGHWYNTMSVDTKQELSRLFMEGKFRLNDAYTKEWFSKVSGLLEKAGDPESEATKSWASERLQGIVAGNLDEILLVQGDSVTGAEDRPDTAVLHDRQAERLLGKTKDKVAYDLYKAKRNLVRNLRRKTGLFRRSKAFVNSLQSMAFDEKTVRGVIAAATREGVSTDPFNLMFARVIMLQHAVDNPATIGVDLSSPQGEAAHTKAVKSLKARLAEAGIDTEFPVVKRWIKQGFKSTADVEKASKWVKRFSAKVAKADWAISVFNSAMEQRPEVVAVRFQEKLVKANTRIASADILDANTHLRGGVFRDAAAHLRSLGTDRTVSAQMDDLKRDRAHLAKLEASLEARETDQAQAVAMKHALRARFPEASSMLTGTKTANIKGKTSAKLLRSMVVISDEHLALRDFINSNKDLPVSEPGVPVSSWRPSAEEFKAARKEDFDRKTLVDSHQLVLVTESGEMVEQGINPADGSPTYSIGGVDVPVDTLKLGVANRVAVPTASGIQFSYEFDGFFHTQDTTEIRGYDAHLQQLVEGDGSPWYKGIASRQGVAKGKTEVTKAAKRLGFKGSVPDMMTARRVYVTDDRFAMLAALVDSREMDHNIAQSKAAIGAQITHLRADVERATTASARIAESFNKVQQAVRFAISQSFLESGLSVQQFALERAEKKDAVIAEFSKHSSDLPPGSMLETIVDQELGSFRGIQTMKDWTEDVHFDDGLEAALAAEKRMLETEAGKLKAAAQKRARVEIWLNKLRPGESGALDWAEGIEISVPKPISVAASAFLGGVELNAKVGVEGQNAIQIINNSSPDGDESYSVVLDSGIAGKLGVSAGLLNDLLSVGVEAGGASKKGFKLDFSAKEDLVAFMQSLVTGEGILETWQNADFIMETSSGGFQAALGVDLSSPLSGVAQHDFGFGLPNGDGKELSVFSQEDGEIGAEVDMSAETGIRLEGSRTYSNAQNAYESTSTTETWGRMTMNFNLPPVSDLLETSADLAGFSAPSAAVDVEVKLSTQTQFTEGVMTGITRSRGVRIDLGSLDGAARRLTPGNIALGLASVMPSDIDIAKAAPQIASKMSELGDASMTYYIDYQLKTDKLLEVHRLRQAKGKKAEKEIARILSDSANFEPAKLRVVSTVEESEDHGSQMSDLTGAKMTKYASGKWESPVYELDFSTLRETAAAAA